MVSGSPNVSSEKSDASLVAAVLAGDRQSFAPLVERHHGVIYNFTYRYTHNSADAEDLTQETFLRAFRALSKYRPGMSFRNWLFAICSNACRDWSRRKKARPEADVNLDPEELGTQQDTPSQHVLAEEQSQELAAAIAALPADYKTAVILFHIQELSQAQIAEALDLPITVIKNRLYRARQMLRKSLERGEVSGVFS